MIIIDRDRLNMADLRAVSNASMGVVDALQNHPPEVQLAAMGVVAKLLTDLSNFPLGDLMAVVQNLTSDAAGKRPEFAAVEMYIEEELA